MTKLWFGFNAYIQTDLWKDKLNPENSSLRAVIAAAEVIEIAHSVTSQRDRPAKGQGNPRQGQKGQGQKGQGQNQRLEPSITTHAGPSRGNDHLNRGTPCPSRNMNSLHPKKSTQRSLANECKSRPQSFRDNQGRNARPGARITKKTRLSKEEHDQ